MFLMQNAESIENRSDGFYRNHHLDRLEGKLDRANYERRVRRSVSRGKHRFISATPTPARPPHATAASPPSAAHSLRRSPAAGGPRGVRAIPLARAPKSAAWIAPRPGRYSRHGDQDARARHRHQGQAAGRRCRYARRGEGCHRSMERTARRLPRLAVVANGPGGVDCGHAMARRALPRLRHEPGH